MGFGVSQVSGIPIGLFIANKWGWQSPFTMIVGLAVIVCTVISIKLQPINKHLKVQTDRNAFAHLLHSCTFTSIWP